MDCRAFQKNLEDYLEGGLDFPGRFGMERHAKQCYLCGKKAAGAQTLSELAKKLERVGSPVNFENDVLARIHAQPESPWFSRVLTLDSLAAEGLFWRRVALTGCALVAGLALVLAFWPEPDNVVSNRSGSQTKQGVSTANSPDVNSLPSLVVSDPAPSAESRAPEITSRNVHSGSANRRTLAEPGDSEYIEYLVPGPAGRQVIMRVPKTIWMRHGQPSEEYFIRHVSH